MASPQLRPLPPPPAPAAATWTRPAGRRWVLTDAEGRSRGWFETAGRGLRAAEALVDGMPIALASSGFATRRLTATAGDGRTTSLSANALSWSGSVQLADGRQLPLSRQLGLATRFVVGTAETPAIAITTRRREVSLLFDPVVATADPGLLPLAVLLHLHHLRSTSAT